MTANDRRELIALKQKLHGLTSTDPDLSAAIMSTRAALDTIRHPEIESFMATVRERTIAILKQTRKK